MGRLSNLGPRIAPLGARLAPPPKVADPFYLSPEWKTFLRILKIARFGSVKAAHCEEVLADGAVCASKHRVIGDHIIERKDGGAPLDPNNIKFRCHSHHQKKTAAARARRARGQTQ